MSSETFGHPSPVQQHHRYKEGDIAPCRCESKDHDAIMYCQRFAQRDAIKPKNSSETTRQRVCIRVQKHQTSNTSPRDNNPFPTSLVVVNVSPDDAAIKVTFVPTSSLASLPPHRPVNHKTRGTRGYGPDGITTYRIPSPTNHDLGRRPDDLWVRLVQVLTDPGPNFVNRMLKRAKDTVGSKPSPKVNNSGNYYGRAPKPPSLGFDTGSSVRDDAFAECRPLCIVVYGSRHPSCHTKGGRRHCCKCSTACDPSSSPTKPYPCDRCGDVVDFVSLANGSGSAALFRVKFRIPVLDVGSNERFVVISFVDRLVLFSSHTLQPMLTIHNGLRSPLHPSGGDLDNHPSSNPFALGNGNWLAFSQVQMYPDLEAGSSHLNTLNIETGYMSKSANAEAPNQKCASSIYKAAKVVSRGLSNLGETALNFASSSKILEGIMPDNKAESNDSSNVHNANDYSRGIPWISNEIENLYKNIVNPNGVNLSPLSNMVTIINIEDVLKKYNGFHYAPNSHVCDPTDLSGWQEEWRTFCTAFPITGFNQPEARGVSLCFKYIHNPNVGPFALYKGTFKSSRSHTLESNTVDRSAEFKNQKMIRAFLTRPENGVPKDFGIISHFKALGGPVHYLHNHKVSDFVRNTQGEANGSFVTRHNSFGPGYHPTSQSDTHNPYYDVDQGIIHRKPTYPTPSHSDPKAHTPSDLYRPNDGDPENVTFLQFNPEGTLLFVAGDVGRVFYLYYVGPHPSHVSGLSRALHIYTLNRGLSVCRYPRSVDFSEDSRWLSVTSENDTVHVYALNALGGGPASVDSHVSSKVSNPLAGDFVRSAGLDRAHVDVSCLRRKSDTTERDHPKRLNRSSRTFRLTLAVPLLQFPGSLPHKIHAIERIKLAACLMDPEEIAFSSADPNTAPAVSNPVRRSGQFGYGLMAAGMEYGQTIFPNNISTTNDTHSISAVFLPSTYHRGLQDDSGMCGGSSGSSTGGITLHSPLSDSRGGDYLPDTNDDGGGGTDERCDELFGADAIEFLDPGTRQTQQRYDESNPLGTQDLNLKTLKEYLVYGPDHKVVTIRCSPPINGRRLSHPRDQGSNGLRASSSPISSGQSDAIHGPQTLKYDGSPRSINNSLYVFNSTLQSLFEYSIDFQPLKITTSSVPTAALVPMHSSSRSYRNSTTGGLLSLVQPLGSCYLSGVTRDATSMMANHSIKPKNQPTLSDIKLNLRCRWLLDHDFNHYPRPTRNNVCADVNVIPYCTNDQTANYDNDLIFVEDDGRSGMGKPRGHKTNKHCRLVKSTPPESPFQHTLSNENDTRYSNFVANPNPHPSPYRNITGTVVDPFPKIPTKTISTWGNDKWKPKILDVPFLKGKSPHDQTRATQNFSPMRSVESESDSDGVMVTNDLRTVGMGQKSNLAAVDNTHNDTTSRPNNQIIDPNQWLSEIEVRTYIGPHRRIWMGPQFSFKTFQPHCHTTILQAQSPALLSTTTTAQKFRAHEPGPGKGDRASLTCAGITAGPFHVEQKNERPDLDFSTFYDDIDEPSSQNTNLTTRAGSTHPQRDTVEEATYSHLTSCGDVKKCHKSSESSAMFKCSEDLETPQLCTSCSPNFGVPLADSLLEAIDTDMDTGSSDPTLLYERNAEGHVCLPQIRHLSTLPLVNEHSLENILAEAVYEVYEKGEINNLNVRANDGEL